MPIITTGNKTIIIDENQNEYVKIDKLGSGGQGKVWKVKSKSDKKEYAFKLYSESDMNELIKTNIRELIDKGSITDDSGNPIKEIVLPLSFVNDDANHQFGYIMELVDLHDYITLNKLTAKNYPSIVELCNISISLSNAFRGIHQGLGFCYKDVNENNIYLNPKTGDVRIIDNDNIGPDTINTIKGTNGYMAPEVILGKAPSARTDQFSFAVYLYRLWVGGWPFEGKLTYEYCVDNDVVLEGDVAKEFLGKKPLFVWHPKDTRNSIDFPPDTCDPDDKQHKIQMRNWNRLDPDVQNGFIQTFVTAVENHNPAERTSDKAWRQIFEAIKYRQTNTSATFTISCSGDADRRITLLAQEIKNGKEISRYLDSNKCIQLLYKKDKFGLQNLSNEEWKVTVGSGANPRGAVVMNSQIAVLEKGMKIRLLPALQVHILSVDSSSISMEIYDNGVKSSATLNRGDKKKLTTSSRYTSDVVQVMHNDKTHQFGLQNLGDKTWETSDNKQVKPQDIIPVKPNLWIGMNPTVYLTVLELNSHK